MGLLKKVAAFCLLAIAFVVTAQGTASAYEEKALILVDTVEPGGVNPPTQLRLASLLGHFDLSYEIKDVDSYAAGDIDAHRVTFYIGNTWDHDLPAAFLDDVLATGSRVVWINYNLWKLGWGPYQQAFEDRYGIRFQVNDDTAGFSDVSFNGIDFSWLSDNYGRVSLLDGGSAQALATVSDGTVTEPYMVRSGNFFYVADDPMQWIAENSQYLVFCELLHEMTGMEHGEQHRALVRIEDVDPTEDPARIRAIADYLYSEGVPFSLAVIPRFTDPLGAWGPPMTVDLADRPELVSALEYAVSKGGTIVMHGYTHQYGTVANAYNAVSGMDSEFYISQMDSQGRIHQVSPVPEDSLQWVQGRIDSGLALFSDAGLPAPAIWETPHYVASELDRQVFADDFGVSYERFGDTFFPYVINSSIYGATVIPENLGYLESGYLEPAGIVDRAGRNLAIRDGFASFFFHSERDIALLKAAVAGIKAQGYVFVDPASLVPSGPPACSGEKPALGWRFADAYWADIGDYQNGILSVDYGLTNNGTEGAFDVRVDTSINTNGVILLPQLPLPLDLGPGARVTLTLRYMVPAGVATFNSVTYISTADACGADFAFPGPSPGSS